MRAEIHDMIQDHDDREIPNLLFVFCFFVLHQSSLANCIFATISRSMVYVALVKNVSIRGRGDGAKKSPHAQKDDNHDAAAVALSPSCGDHENCNDNQPHARSHANIEGRLVCSCPQLAGQIWHAGQGLGIPVLM